MKCTYSEKDIALYVGGDLPAVRLRQVETHLEGCGECRELASELGESQAMFRGLRQDVVSGAALSAVRQRVLSEVAGQDTWARKLERVLYLGFRWKWALAGAGLCAMAAGLGVWYALSPVSAPGVVIPIAVAKPPLAEAPAPAEVAPIRSVRRNTKTQRHGDAKKDVKEDAKMEEARQLVVKLLTDDPNIVIYWLVDQKGGGE